MTLRDNENFLNYYIAHHDQTPYLCNGNSHAYTLQFNIHTQNLLPIVIYQLTFITDSC